MANELHSLTEAQLVALRSWTCDMLAGDWKRKLYAAKRALAIMGIDWHNLVLLAPLSQRDWIALQLSMYSVDVDADLDTMTIMGLKVVWHTGSETSFAQGS